MNKGIFIVFEGGEGSGKSTMIKKAYNYLKEQGQDVIMTREPGGVSISEDIRSIILNPYNEVMDGRTEALLYTAARRQHLVEKVIPALERGAIVLCDRFIMSSLAYQGYARGLGVDAVMNINKYAIGDYMPDFTFYLHVDTKVGLARASKRNYDLNRLDLESIEFHDKVREGYLNLVTNDKNAVIIDANAKKEFVWEDIRRIITTVQPMSEEIDKDIADSNIFNKLVEM